MGVTTTGKFAAVTNYRDPRSKIVNSAFTRKTGIGVFAGNKFDAGSLSVDSPPGGSAIQRFQSAVRHHR